MHVACHVVNVVVSTPTPPNERCEMASLVSPHSHHSRTSRHLSSLPSSSSGLSPATITQNDRRHHLALRRHSHFFLLSLLILSAILSQGCASTSTAAATAVALSLGSSSTATALALASTSADESEGSYRTSANRGENVVLRCTFDFPDGFRVPYVIHWEKQGVKIPIYIWYDGYPPHVGEGYEGRVGLSGQASLNLTNVRESDQGWYECKVFFLNRPPEPIKNGTWVQLDVLAPPQFRTRPPEVIYVKLGESISLPCEAAGTPRPEIVWYKDGRQLRASGKLHISETELRLSGIGQQDTGEYRCAAKNREGTISTSSQIIVAGPAVITLGPSNQTKLEGDRVEFDCVAKALPSNVTHRWFHNGVEISNLAWMENRVAIKHGTLVITPAIGEDSGRYTCEVSNGIGLPETSGATLSIEYPARVYYSPTIQYLPLGLSGVVRCYIQATPSSQFVTWTKDRMPFDPNSTPGVVTLNNGSLLISKVTPEHQGIYRCAPYNIHGSSETSQAMEVLVRDPPKFTAQPKQTYVRTVNDEVSMPCDGTGQPKPNVYWRKSDGSKLPVQRTTLLAGNLTLKLLKKEDHGVYECVLENEIAIVIAPAQIIINNTTPHTPTNVTVNTSYFSATVSWAPGFNGGYEQTYHLSYRISEQGEPEWKTIKVPSPEETSTFTLYNLQADTEYEFQVYSSNMLGNGSPSSVIRASTRAWSFGDKIYPTDASGATYIPTVQKPSGPKPDSAQNLTLQKMAQGWVLSWLPPVNRSVAVAYYRVEYRADERAWLYTDPIPYDTAHLFKQLEANSRYTFRVWAYSILGVGEVSEMIEVNLKGMEASANVAALTAAIIGAFLFFTSTILAAVCAVKVCNQRKRKKIEKSYMMVTCPVNGTTTSTSGFGDGDSPVPTKQMNGCFETNQMEMGGEYLPNMSPLPMGYLDIPRLATASLDNSTTTTNTTTTGTTGSDLGLVPESWHSDMMLVHQAATPQMGQTSQGSPSWTASPGHPPMRHYMTSRPSPYGMSSAMQQSVAAIQHHHHQGPPSMLPPQTGATATMMIPMAYGQEAPFSGIKSGECKKHPQSQQNNYDQPPPLLASGRGSFRSDGSGQSQNTRRPFSQISFAGPDTKTLSSRAPLTLHQFQKSGSFRTSSPTNELFSRMPNFSREFSSIPVTMDRLRELPSLRPIHEPAALQRASETIARLRATLPIHSRLARPPILESVPEAVYSLSQQQRESLYQNLPPPPPLAVRMHIQQSKSAQQQLQHRPGNPYQESTSRTQHVVHRPLALHVVEPSSETPSATSPSGSDDHRHQYTRERLLGAVEKVRSAGQLLNRTSPYRHTIDGRFKLAPSHRTSPTGFSSFVRSHPYRMSSVQAPFREYSAPPPIPPRRSRGGVTSSQQQQQQPLQSLPTLTRSYPWNDPSGTSSGFISAGSSTLHPTTLSLSGASHHFPLSSIDDLGMTPPTPTNSIPFPSTPPNIGEEEVTPLRAFSRQLQTSRNREPFVEPLGDLSVDENYEFDQCSPVGGSGSASKEAELIEQLTRDQRRWRHWHTWQREQSLAHRYPSYMLPDPRNLSIYGTIGPQRAHQTRPDSVEEIEERCAALRREFLDYRKRVQQHDAIKRLESLF